MWSQLQLLTGDPGSTHCVSINCVCVCVSPCCPLYSSTLRHSQVKGRANINGEDYSLIAIISRVTHCDPGLHWCSDKLGSHAKSVPSRVA